MAIGSAPEIGYQFTMWGRMTPEARLAWFQFMREHWGDNLYAGEASIQYPNEQLRTKYFNEIMEEVNASNL
jgi:hypothetical protein